MAVTLEDIRREMARRQSAPEPAMPPAEPPSAQPGISLDDVKREMARREQAPTPVQPKESKSALDYIMMGAFGPFGGPAVKETIADPSKQVEAFKASGGGGPILPMAGETVGRMAGAPFGPPGVAVGGAFGAGAGELGRQVLAGEDLDFKQALIEGALSLGIGTAMEGVSMAGRKLLSRVPEGIKEGERLAAGKLRQEAPQLLKPESRQSVSQMFDQVAKSGVKIDPQGIRLDLLDDDQFRVFLREIRQIPAGPGFEPGLGNRLAEGIEAIRAGKPTEGFDIGELQQLRSRLMKQAGAKKEGAVQDVLALGTRLIDEGIESGRVSGPASNEAIDLLKNARAKWRVIRQSDDLANMAMAATTRTKGGRTTIHLGKLKGVLEDAPQRGVMAKASEVLNQNPSAKEALAELVTRFEKINIEGGINMGRLGGPVERITYGILGVLGARPAARERFMRLVEQQRGTITTEQLSIFLNQARRELQGAADLGGSSIFFPPDQQPAYPPR